MPSRIKGHTRKIIGGAPPPPPPDIAGFVNKGKLSSNSGTAKETYKNLFKKCENMSESNCKGCFICDWRPIWVDKDGKHEKS